MQKEKKHILLNTFAQQMKKQLKDIPPSRVAVENGISTSIMSLTVRGKKNLSLTTLWQISEALEIYPDELIKSVRKNLPEDYISLDV